MRESRDGEMVTLSREELRQIIREEVEASFGALKTSSCMMSENAKGDRVVEIKQYDVSAQAAYDAVSRVFDQAVREKRVIGTGSGPLPDVGLGLRMRRERE